MEGFNKNNTGKYLLPCIYKYPPLLVNMLSRLTDVTYYYKDEYNQSVTECLFIKVKYNSNNTPIINKIKKSIYFVDSYLYSDISSKEYVIVLSLPKDCIDTYKAFERGEYSKMYSPEFLKDLLDNKRITKSIYDVLAKTKEGKNKFVKILESKFNVNLKKEWEDEYDFKPTKEDVLN